MRSLSAVKAVASGDRGYRRRVRILLAVLLMLLFVPTYSTVPRRPILGRVADLTAMPVPLDPGDPARRRAGRLTLLGGVALTSRDPAFGGFSSMRVANGRITLLSDMGTVVSFRLAPGGRIEAPRFSNLPAGPGRGWEKADRDSESMTTDPATGRIWVGFESWNQIWRYAPGFARAQRWIAPPAMADWPIAGGAESLVRLHDGHFVVFSETDRLPGAHARTALWFDGDPTVSPGTGFVFGYRPPRHYDPSDAVELPDGDLLVLNRRFRLPYDFTARLTIVRRADIRPGAVVTGTEIARFAAPLIHDNFEALAVTREHGATIVWMASDDNQSILQRSLLLKFRLEPAAPAG